MRAIGCIPTKKFVTDMVLIRDMLFALKQLKSSVPDVSGGQLQL